MSRPGSGALVEPWAEATAGHLVAACGALAVVAVLLPWRRSGARWFGGLDADPWWTSPGLATGALGVALLVGGIAIVRRPRAGAAPAWSILAAVAITAIAAKWSFGDGGGALVPRATGQAFYVMSWGLVLSLVAGIGAMLAGAVALGRRGGRPLTAAVSVVAFAIDAALAAGLSGTTVPCGSFEPFWQVVVLGVPPTVLACMRWSGDAREARERDEGRDGWHPWIAVAMPAVHVAAVGACFVVAAGLPVGVCSG